MKYLKKILAFVFLFFTFDIVYAETTTKLHFCEYPGVLRAFKITGILLTICKVVVPLVLIYTVIMNLVKIVISGKQDELTAFVPKAAKKIIAGLVVFLIPTLVDYAVSTLANITDNTEMTPCTTCMFTPSRCSIPEEDPVITTRE